MKYGDHEIDDYYVQTRVLPRILKRTRKQDECLVCRGAGSRGYLRITIQTIDGKKVHARPHRIIAILFFGDIGNLDVDHECRNRACVNVRHLKPCTTQENTRLMFKRRRDDLFVNQIKMPWAGDD